MIKNFEESFKNEIMNLSFQHPQKKEILTTYSALNDYLVENPIKGACHVISGIMYILLNEQRIDSELCIGVIHDPRVGVYDHSWVEIDGVPYDLAIQLPLDEILVRLLEEGQIETQPLPAVFAGYDLKLEGIVQTQVNYRNKGNLDSPAKDIYLIPLTNYLDYAPPGQGWDMVKQICSVLDISFSKNILRDKYKHTGRTLI